MNWIYELLPNVCSLLFLLYASTVKNNFRSRLQAKPMELNLLFSAGFRMKCQISWRRSQYCSAVENIQPHSSAIYKVQELLLWSYF